MTTKPYVPIKDAPTGLYFCWFLATLTAIASYACFIWAVMNLGMAVLGGNAWYYGQAIIFLAWTFGCQIIWKLFIWIAKGYTK